MHKLLEKQLKKSTDQSTGAVDMERLMTLVSETYSDFDRMRAIESRAMQLMSDELNAANEAIRQESAAKISESQRRFEIAMNGTQDGIWDWNVQSDIVTFSKRTLFMLGYTESDFDTPGISQWLSMVDPDDQGSAKAFLDSCRQGEAHAVVTLRFRDKGGRVRHILCRAQGIRDGKGKPARVVGVHTDLSDLIQMQEELRKSRDRAEAANRAKSEFLANMTHELRTPLNSIVTLARIIMDSKDEEERKKFMDMISISSELLLTIVNDILDFSKIEANEMKLEEIGFDLVSAVGKALVPVRHAAASKDLEFRIRFDCKTQIPYLLGDPYRLGQVITNLASNAVKYTETGGISITVSASPDDVDNTVDISVTVKDTGIGIPTERQKTIFDKFSQADTSTTRRYGGTGLGLAISSRIVKLMGGDISVKS